MPVIEEEHPIGETLDAMLDSDAEALPAAPPTPHWRSVALEWSLVLAGGFVGTLVRAGISLVWGPRIDHGFPWDILLINCAGAFLIGLLAGWRDPHSRQHELIWLAGATGFLGAFTTFSSFALGIVNLELSGNLILSLAYLFGSVALGLLTVELGLHLGERAQQAAR